jgi:hypothetical protein
VINNVFIYPATILKGVTAMEIIMLSGPSRCGKTDTLNLVYDKIAPSKDGAAKIIECKKQLGANKKDFECVIERGRGYIAFCTMGDYSKYLVDTMRRYSTYRCNEKGIDLLILACNTTLKKPYAEIKKYKHVLIDKVKNEKTHSDQDICDEIHALVTKQ